MVSGENFLLGPKRSGCSESAGQTQISQGGVQLAQEGNRAAPPADCCAGLDPSKRTEGVAEDIRGRQ